MRESLVGSPDRSVMVMPDMVPMIPPAMPTLMVPALSEIVDWGQEFIGVSQYREQNATKGQGINVAVLDSGVSKEHPDLTPNVAEQVDFTGDQRPFNPHGCIQPDAMIYTSLCGLQPIETMFERACGIVHENDDTTIKDVSRSEILVLSYDPITKTTEYRRLVAVHRLKYDGDVHRVSTSQGNLSLTPWHPVYAVRSTGIEKVRADALQLGDILLCSGEAISEIGDVIHLPLKTEWICKHCGHRTRSEMRRQCRKCARRDWHDGPTTSIALDERLGFLCGLIASGRHVFDDGLSISFCGNDDRLVGEFERLTLDVFGIVCKTRRTYGDGGSCTQVRLHSVDVNRLMREIGILSGNKCRTIRFPELIAKSPKSVIWSFVAGMIEGNGHIDGGAHSGSVRIATGSEAFADDLTMLMRTMGRHASKSTLKPKPRCGRISSDNPSYQVHLGMWPEIADRLVIKSPERIMNPRPRRGTKIRSITVERHSGYLYDFTVEGTHNYVANGVVVSNTHVGGIIAAAADDHGVVGVAPEAKLHSVRVLDSDGLCPVDYSWVIQGLEWVADHREIDIVNLSLGAPIQPPDRMQSIIRSLAARGTLVVAASGNDSSNVVSWPARYDECIAVAAMDKDGKIARFSNVDASLEVVAPGVDIYSTWINGGYGYAKESGTCLPGYTQLMSSSGPLSMLDVKEGDELISCDPTTLRLQRNTVAKKWSRGVRQLYRVRTSNWTLDGTGNHPVLTVGITKGDGKKGNGNRKSYSFVWKRIDELREGDLVFHIHDVDLPQLENPDVVEDLSFAKLLGFMIGDGWLSSPRHGMYMVAFARGEHEHINREYEDLLAEISDCPVHITKDGRQCYTFGKRLFYLLSHFGVDDGARNKRVPKAIFEAARDVRRAFLVGYLDADGTTPKKTALKGLAFSSASLSLVDDMKNLLATVGVQTGNIYSRHRESKISGRIIRGDEHSTTICRSEACRLFDMEFTRRGGIERVGHEIIRDKTVRQMILDSGLRVSKVKSVETTHSEMVYDIEMTDQSAPCFIANGIVVHNSMSAPFISGILALMIAYHRNGDAHQTPMTNYLEAVSHLQGFQDGKLVAGLPNHDVGVGVLNFHSALARQASSCRQAEAAIKTPHFGLWRKLYRWAEALARRILLGG